MALKATPNGWEQLKLAVEVPSGLSAGVQARSEALSKGHGDDIDYLEARERSLEERRHAEAVGGGVEIVGRS